MRRGQWLPMVAKGICAGTAAARAAASAYYLSPNGYGSKILPFLLIDRSRPRYGLELVYGLISGHGGCLGQGRRGGETKNLPQKMLHLPRPKGPRTAREALQTNTCVGPLRLRGCCRRRLRGRTAWRERRTESTARRKDRCKPTCENPGSVGSVGLGLSVGSVCSVGLVLPVRAQGMDANFAGFVCGSLG